MVARCLLGLFLAALLFLRTPGEALFREEFGPGWKERWKKGDFRGALQWAVVENDGDNPVLRLDSSRSAGAYFAAVTGDAREVGWRWKVQSRLTGDAPERSKEGDDYAARVFVIFDPLPLGRQTRALCYVWARSEPRESFFLSPYFDRVATIVLESGGDRVGDWVSERRVLGDDFRRSFGSPPPAVKGVAIMVDTDDTGARATAWFDDVVLR